MTVSYNPCQKKHHYSKTSQVTLQSCWVNVVNLPIHTEMYMLSTLKCTSRLCYSLLHSQAVSSSHNQWQLYWFHVWLSIVLTKWFVCPDEIIKDTWYSSELGYHHIALIIFAYEYMLLFDKHKRAIETNGNPVFM